MKKQIVNEDEADFVLGADDNKIQPGDIVVAVEDIEKGFSDGGRTPKIAYKAGTQLTVESVDRNDNGEYIYVEDDDNEYDAYLFRKVAPVKERSADGFNMRLMCDIYSNKVYGNDVNNIIEPDYKEVMLFPINVSDDELVAYMKSEAGKEYPAVVLQTRRGYLSAVPGELKLKGSYGMFGGAFIYSSDGRFPNDYPIALHDRVENYSMGESKVNEASGDKIKVKSIWLRRAEGPSPLPQPVTVSSYEEANKVLRDWSETAPKENQGYDKTDFKVVFEDGNTYDGRLDIKHWSASNNDLDVVEHMYDNLAFYAGIRKPGHMKQQAYQDYINSQGEESKKGAQDFLNKYDLGHYNKIAANAATPEEKSRQGKADKLENDLANFTGTEHWYKNDLFPGYTYTDGVRYLAKEAGAYWLVTDILSTARSNKALRDQEFLVWELKVKDGKATLTADDGNGNIMFTKHYDYTDFPLDSIKLYLSNNVLLLPSEN